MSVEENKAIVRRLYEGDWTNPDFLDEFVAVDVVGPGKIRDLNTLKKSVAANFAGLPDMHYIIEDIIGEGDKVVVRYSASGTQTDEWFGLAPTNKRATWAGTAIYRIAGGKIVEYWQNGDQVGLWRQVGLLPSWKELVEQANAKLG